MKNILLVEDNEMNRDMLARRLERKGFNVYIATNGEEALIKAAELLPDIILMDMSLPVIDGWQATKTLKTQKETSHIPIIGLSAHAREEDIMRGKQAGCDAYETKPIDLPLLLGTMERLF